MRKLYVLFLLLISCSSPKPIATIVTVCDYDKAGIWVKECLQDLGADSVKPSIKAGCWKQAREIFCKNIKVLKIKGELVPCDSVPNKYKIYCK